MTKFIFQQVVNHDTKWNPLEEYNTISINSNDLKDSDLIDYQEDNDPVDTFSPLSS